MVELQERLVEAERAKVVLETAGAAAHEINQPLTVLTGTLQLMMEDLPGAPPARDSLEACLGATDRIADIVRKMRAARRYVTRPYLRGTDIVDFEEASQDQEEEPSSQDDEAPASAGEPDDEDSEELPAELREAEEEVTAYVTQAKKQRSEIEKA